MKNVINKIVQDIKTHIPRSANFPKNNVEKYGSAGQAICQYKMTHALGTLDT